VRLRPDIPVALAALLTMCALLSIAPPARAVGGSTPTQQEVERAIETVKKDPNLAAERTVKTLKWKGAVDEDKPRPRHGWPDWLSWIPNLFSWIGQVSQMLVWVLIAALVGLLALFIVRLVRDTRLSPKGSRFIAPTHVQDLDIRPESLPPDIGAAARALWDRGEHRAALALLYRGLLSRLAHVHEVAIRDSSTEGDCLALAARRLDPARMAYITQIVRTWQRFTYGGQQIEDAAVHELCAGFTANLDPPAESAATGNGNFAKAGA
jgi:uncharacterized protein DUF4129